MKALTFIARFQTAQFKLHFQILARGTYLLPPPSAVAGLFCAMLGVSRDQLKSYCSQNNLLAGAELRNLKGFYTTISRIFKFDRKKEGLIKLLNEWVSRQPKGKKRSLKDVFRDVVGLMPLKESEELYEPEFKFVIAAEDEVIEEGLKRIRELDFEYDIFGGNDYHFVHSIERPQEAQLVKASEGRGYCPMRELQAIKADSYILATESESIVGIGELHPLLICAPMGPGLDYFAFVYGADIVTKKELDAVRDEDSTVFVYEASKYLVP